MTWNQKRTFEQMKPVKGYEGLYSVTEDGRIYSHIKGRFFESKSKARYLTVRLVNKYGDAKVLPIHRIVAEAYLPNPDNLPVVDHKDTNTHNNQATNLEWVTQKENVHRCIRNGNFGTMNRRRH